MDLREALADMSSVLADVSTYLQDDKFDEHMDSDDLLSVVLRAHLWIERELRLLIRDPLPNAEHLKASWSFRHQAELVAALDIISAQELKALLYLNKLRNNLAHRFDYTLTQNEQAALLQRVPDPIEQTVTTRVSEQFPAPLREALKFLVIMVVLRRKGLVAPVTTPDPADAEPA